MISLVAKDLLDLVLDRARDLTAYVEAGLDFSFARYADQAMRTVPEMPLMQTLAMCGLGLAGEVAELRQEARKGTRDKLFEELGDVAWYAAVLLNSVGRVPDTNKTSPHLVQLAAARKVLWSISKEPGVRGESLYAQTGVVADLIKKVVYHGHGESLPLLADEAEILLYFLVEFSLDNAVSLGGACGRNLHKLRKRYPDGFSVERSKRR